MGTDVAQNFENVTQFPNPAKAYRTPHVIVGELKLSECATHTDGHRWGWNRDAPSLG